MSHSHTAVSAGCYVAQFDTAKPSALETKFPSQTWAVNPNTNTRKASAPERGALKTAASSDGVTLTPVRPSLSSQCSDSENEARQRGFREALLLSTRQRSRNRRQLQARSGQAIADGVQQQSTEPVHLSCYATQTKLHREQLRDLPHACYVRQNYETLLESASRREHIMLTFRAQRQEHTELQTYSGQIQ